MLFSGRWGRGGWGLHGETSRGGEEQTEEAKRSSEGGGEGTKLASALPFCRAEKHRVEHLSALLICPRPPTAPPRPRSLYRLAGSSQKSLSFAFNP